MEDVRTALRWMGEGTAFFLDHLQRVTDAELREACALPGWSRAHLAAHVARNAEGLTRLLTWARTGHEQRMYPDPSQREVEIERRAGQPAGALRADVRVTADAFRNASTGVQQSAWQTKVLDAKGRTTPAANVPWMRAREVWIHAIDLHCGARFDQVPEVVTDALIAEAVTRLRGAAERDEVRLYATDRDKMWAGTDSVRAPVVRGRASDLLAWVTGRSQQGALHCDTGPLPRLPQWI